MNLPRIDLKKIHYQKPLLLIVVALIISILQPGIFLTFSNFRSIFLSIAIYGIMVCGAIYTILLGGIDLAVGANAALSGAITVQIITHSGGGTEIVIFAVIVGLLAAAFSGLFFGFVIANFDVPPFLVTLAGQYVVYGITQLLTQNKVISCLEPESFTFLGGGRLFGIPFSIIILIVFAIISYFILRKTIIGRYCYAVGGNRTASKLSGVPTKKVILFAYAFSGFAAGLAGIVLASMNQQAIAKAAQGYENDVLTAIVVGGTSLMGGEGTLGGAMFGALLIGMINNGLRLMGVPSIYHSVVKGIIIITAVAIDAHGRYKSSGLQRKSSNLFLNNIFRKKKRETNA